MDLDSVYFSMLRAEAKHSEVAPAQRCEMAGCEQGGAYRAPGKRGGADKFFCADHIRAYNQSYDYFTDMSEAEIIAFQKSSITGHRPTWRLGARGPRRMMIHSYFDLFRHRHRHHDRRAPPRKARLLPRKARALKVLGLGDEASTEQIKMRFKELVKRYHPDLHGGGRKYEQRLSAVIQSYNELKKGF